MTPLQSYFIAAKTQHGDVGLQSCTCLDECECECEGNPLV